MEEIPRRTSLALRASLCFVLYLIGVEQKGFLNYQGKAGIMSIVRWNLRLFIFGAENGKKFLAEINFVKITKVALKILDMLGLLKKMTKTMSRLSRYRTPLPQKGFWRGL